MIYNRFVLLPKGQALEYTLGDYRQFLKTPTSERAACLIIDLAEFLEKKDKRQLSEYLKALHDSSSRK